jgi:hypothetical protein
MRRTISIPLPLICLHKIQKIDKTELFLSCIKTKTIKGKMLKIFFALLFLFFCGCFEYASLQTARMLSPHEIYIMPEYGPVGYTHSRKFNKVSNNVGFQFGYGISNSFNVFAQINRIQLCDYNMGYNFLSINSKFKIIKDRLAFSLPVCLYFGRYIESSETAHIQPTLYFTTMVNKYFDITLSPKYIVHFPSFQTIIAINGNVGIHFFNERISFVPEIGYASNPDAKDRFLYGNLGLGYTIKTNAKKK